MEARGRAKLGLIRGLYERGYAREQIPELFRLIDWMLALPPEQEALLLHEVERIEEERRMPYITNAERIGQERWERIGLQRGEQIGLREGLREGRLEGQRAVLRRLVQARFGTAPEALGRQINTADEPQLDQLIDRIAAAATLNEMEAESEQPA